MHVANCDFVAFATCNCRWGSSFHAWMHGQRSQDLGNLSPSSYRAVEGQYPGPILPAEFNRACAVHALATRTFMRYALFCAWFLVVFPQQGDKIKCTPNCPIPRTSKLGTTIGTRGFSIYLEAGCWRPVACGCATTSGRWPKSGKASSKQIPTPLYLVYRHNPNGHHGDEGRLENARVKLK